MTWLLNLRLSPGKEHAASFARATAGMQYMCPDAVAALVHLETTELIG